MGLTVSETRFLQDQAVLLMAPDRHFNQLLRPLLAGLGIKRIDSCTELGLAQGRLSLPNFNLLIADCDQSGAEVLRLIETMRQLPNPRLALRPAILITGQPTPALREQAKQLHIQHLIAKPLTAASFCGPVAAALFATRTLAVPPRPAAMPQPVPAAKPAVAVPTPASADDDWEV